MKLTAIIIFTTAITASATGHSQTVTLDLKNVPVQKVFKEVMRQTGISIVYTETLFSNTPPVTVKVKDAPVPVVLDQVLKNSGVDYALSGGTIVIKIKQNAAFQPAGVFANEPPPVDITGRITNEQGQALSGASVIIKRTGHGDISDANGNFTLKNVNADDILIISYVGYRQQKIKVGSISNFTIVMEIATDELDKVRVQAYGKTTDRVRTGNIATVTAEEIERQPVMNPLQALEGKVPGLVVSQNSGYASAPFKIELRGRSVIDPSRPSEPLYIIDGVPLTVIEIQGNYAGSTGFLQNGLEGPAGGQSPFFNINPGDVESITVLKDADATAIYGSRGANGVIIVNTKKGKAGKTKLNLTAYQGLSVVTQHYDMLNLQQYLTMRHEAFNNDGITPDQGNAYDLLVWDTTQYRDWQKFLWGNKGKTTDIQANLTGGDKQTIFRVAGAYHRETGILTTGSDQRGSAQFSLSHNSLDQKLNMSFTSAYSFTQSDLVSLPGAANYPADAPSAFDSKGNINWQQWNPASNPFGVLLDPYSGKTSFLNSQLSLQYEIIKGLQVTVKAGYSSSHNSQTFIQPIISQDPQYSPTGIANFGSNNNSNAIVEPQFEYSRLLGKGKINLLLGGSVQSASQDGNNIQGSGYINDLLLYSISNAPTRTATDITGKYKYGAAFLRLNYNFENKYVINISGRRDGSSKFGPGKQYGNFGAVGLAWLLTEENWFKKHLNFLSFGKVRGSYGITGSDNIGNYNFLSQWSTFSIPYFPGMPAYVPLLHSNPDLQWQSNKKLEAALDLGFLKDRISFEIAWYLNRCGNQLVSIPLPTQTGFQVVTANLPATIQNTGLESVINAKIIDGKSFSWSANFDIGANRNKLVSFPNLAQSPYASQFIIGQPLNIVKLLHYIGVDPQTGLYTFEDKNHDGQINSNASDTLNDFYAKDLSVKFDGGFGTDLRYKGWQLNLFFRFRKQQIPSSIAYMGEPGGIGNYSAAVMNRWQKVGDHAKFARFTTNADFSDLYFYNYSDGIYSDGSYIRLQNVSLSYDFPGQWLKSMKLQSLRLFFRGENLFLITKYDGLDPDTRGFGGLPPTKIFTSGIQINF